eukprot:5291171-Amphidinium_carterae.1
MWNPKTFTWGYHLKIGGLFFEFFLAECEEPKQSMNGCHIQLYVFPIAEKGTTIDRKTLLYMRFFNIKESKANLIEDLQTLG